MTLTRFAARLAALADLDPANDRHMNVLIDEYADMAWPSIWARYSRTFASHPYMVDDVKQTLKIGVWEALKTYHPGKGGQRWMYVRHLLVSRVLRAFASEFAVGNMQSVYSWLRREPGPGVERLDKPAEFEGDELGDARIQLTDSVTPDSVLAGKEISAKLAEVLRALTPTDLETLTEWADGKTTRESAKLRGVTYQAISLRRQTLLQRIKDDVEGRVHVRHARKSVSR